VSDPAAQFRSGLIYGLVAYLWWGAVPLYFAALKAHGVPAIEILAHRITWSLRVLRNRKLVLTLLLSSILLATNWLLYIYATVTSRVTEASLGYFMMPLMNAALGTFFLGEKLRPAHFPALALVAIGVAVPAIAGGFFPWLAISLTISFGSYGLVRKQAPVESLSGLTVESLLLLPPSLTFLIYLSATGANHMGSDWGLNGLIVFSGVVTVVPLLAFTLSIRRLPLLAISFIQFLSPTVQMILAVTLLDERDRLTPATIAAFVCVWVAVAIFIADAVWQARAKRKAYARTLLGLEVVTQR
jgi:chloramphenicol-sensitive protein RarD